jgi:serine/threonine protein kinase
LYDLLANRLPFEVSDPLEMIRCHLAQSPVPLSEIDAGFLQPLSDIVHRLLAKNADDRYQSAQGLGADLAECLNQLQTSGSIGSFELGRDEYTGRFHRGQVRSAPADRALLCLGAGLIHHSDQGSQYTDGTYQALLRAHSFQASMNGVGTWYDNNALMESFFGTLKGELVHHRVYHTRDEARPDLFFYIETFYNRRRPLLRVAQDAGGRSGQRNHNYR